jgi:hypothetical protein
MNEINQNPNENGRINLINSNSQNGTPFFLQDKNKIDDKTNYFNTIQYTIEPSKLSILFLSYENRIIIQNAIKAGVYKLSNQKYIIDRQSDDTLNAIMSGIYLQYSKNNGDIKTQIEELNNIVIDYCVPKIYSELKSYIQYKVDASTLVVPMINPVSTYNSKELVLNNFF